MLLSRRYWSKTNSIISTSVRLYNSRIETVKNAYIVYETKNSVTTKPPLIIMHAMMGAASQWSTTAKAIHEATGRKVIAMDARNHGESPRSPDLTHMSLTHDVIQTIESLGLPKVSFLGHSLGAKTAMYIALFRPDLVSSLVVEDMSPISNQMNRNSVLTVLDGMACINFKTAKDMSEAKKLAYEGLQAVTVDQKLINYLSDGLTYKDGGYCWKTNVEAIRNSFESQENFTIGEQMKGKQYCGPTLFIGGAESPHIPKEDFPGIKKLFPNANLTYVEGSNHWIHVEKPEEFMRILLKFLEDH